MIDKLLGDSSVCHPGIISRFVLGLMFPRRFALAREPIRQGGKGNVIDQGEN